MEAPAFEDLIRRIRSHERKALDCLLSDIPQAHQARIADVVGMQRVHDFIFEHVDQFHGGTLTAFLEWLRSLSQDEMTDWLIGRIKAGDPEARECWLTRHRDRLKKWTELRVGVSPGHGGDASDVVQETAIDLIKKFPDGITTENQLLRWVRTTLRRRAIDLSRKKVLHTLAQQTSADSSFPGRTHPLAKLAAADSSASKRALRNEREECILSCSEDVSNEQLCVVLFRLIDECCLNEIAQGLGLARVEVARLYYQGIRGLRATLDHLEIGDWAEDEDTLHERLVREMAKLPESQREAVELKHLENYTLWEIAQVLGYTDDAGSSVSDEYKRRKEQAVGQLLVRGVRSLKDVLEALAREASNPKTRPAEEQG